MIINDCMHEGGAHRKATKSFVERAKKALFLCIENDEILFNVEASHRPLKCLKQTSPSEHNNDGRGDMI